MGFSGRCEAIKAPTTENDTIWVRRMTVVGIPVSTISYRVCLLRRLKIRHAPASATHSRHSDQGQPRGDASAHLTDPSTLFPCPFCHNHTLQHYRLPSVTTTVTKQKIQHELRRIPKRRTSQNTYSTHSGE